jgi:integrase
MEDIEDKKKIQDRMRAVAVISAAAFAGLRVAEIRSLRWSDYDGQSLAIRRAV